MGINIFNFDETLVCFEMIARTTIANIGEKTVSARSFNSTHQRISLLLYISASGEKLAPLIIFKDKPDGYKEKILKSNKYVKSKKIFAFTQEIHVLIIIYSIYGQKMFFLNISQIMFQV